MKMTVKRILSIIALVFAGIFTLCFPFYLATFSKTDLLSMILGAVTITALLIGLILWGTVIVIDKRDKRIAREAEEKAEADAEDKAESAAAAENVIDEPE